VDGSNDTVSRAFNWLAGDRLSDVLHIGDHALAYRFSDQGHDVVVVGEDARNRHDSDISYVCGRVDRLPFVGSSFDLVVLPSLNLSPVELAGIARILRPRGYIATVARVYDDTIPWVRRLLQIAGVEPPSALADQTLAQTGLFRPAEVNEIADWEVLDLPGTVRFARDLAGPSLGDDRVDQVRDLFAQSAQQTGTLRLRHRTQYVRAEVDKSQIQDDDDAADVTLFDLQ